MATVKNFGLAGVGSKIQLGKSGGHLDYGSVTADQLSAVNEAGSGLDFFNVLNPTSGSHAATKFYVDGVATGLDVKSSTRVATLDVTDLSGFTYTVTSDNETVGAAPWGLAGGTPIFDGVTVINGDRVLIKDSADAKGNGIFTYNSTASGTFVRAVDADNSPANEVSGGMFTFVEEGTQADNGYVVASPNGAATLGVDDIVFSQFSGAGQITAGTGMTKDANTLNVIGSATIIAQADSLEVNSSGTAGQILISGGTAGTAAAFGALDLDVAASVTNTLGVSNGGTNLSTIADRSILVSTGADILAVLTADSSGNDEVLLWDDSVDNFVFVEATTLGSAFNTITGDSGTDTAVGSETMAIVGATNGGITTAVTANSTSIAITLTDLAAGGEILALADVIAVNDSADGAAVTAKKYSFQDMVDDLNIVNGITANGFLVRTTGDTYASRTIVASSTTTEEGIIINNGDGIAGNPEVGLDIEGLTLDTTISGTDTLVIFNGTNNVKTTVANLVSGGSLAWTSITDGTTTGTADSASDTITFTGTNGVTAIVSNDPETVTFNADINGLVGTTPVTTSTTIMVDVADGGTNTKRTLSDVMDDLDIVHNLGGNGIAVQTSGDTYTNRSVAISVAAGDEGLSIVNGDGVGGDMTVGLDIVGLTLESVIDDTDFLVMYNGTNNRKITVAELIGDIDNQTIVSADGDTSVTTADSGEGMFANTVEIKVGGDLDFTFDTTKLALLNGAVIHNSVGTAALPAYTFAGDTDTGYYQTGTDGETCIVSNTKEVLCFRIESGATGDEHIVIEAGDGEGRIVAEGTDANIDIRLVPKGTGQVFLGEPGTAASITTSDGANASADGEDLTISAGDSGNASGDGGSIVITPGSGISNDGTVCITDDDSVNVMCFEGVNTAVNYIVTTNAAAAGSPVMTATGADTNIDMLFLPKGTGVLSVLGTTTYENNITADDDIPNRKFVVDADAAVLSGATTTLYDTMNDTGLVTGTNTIPLNARITRVVVNVTAAYTGSQGFDIGTAAGAIRVAADSVGFVDWQTTGTYIIEEHEVSGVGASLFVMGIQNVAAGTGAASVRVEFSNAV